MTISLATLGQQALRRLGVRVVPLDDSPTLTETVTAAHIGTQALVELGVYNVYEASQPIETVGPADVATAALVELGVLNSDETPAALGTVAQATIATGALTELGVIAADETPSTSDQALAVDKVASVHGSLVDQGIALWDIAAIPRAFAEEYVKLTAAMSASSFGKTVDPAIVAMLEGRVRAGATVLNNNQGFMQGHVSSVHDGLIKRGIASWSVNQIPRGFMEEYTKLTAIFAATSFGKQADPALIPVFEDRIRHGAMVMRMDQTTMLGHVAAVHGALDAQGVVFWDGDAVPRAFVEEYVKLTVAFAATSLGKQIDPAIIPALEARVRKGVMVLSADDNANQAAQAVHDDLVMRGIARWSSLDIPDALGDPYVVLIGDNLAPLFGVQSSKDDVRDAFTAIYRYTALPTSGQQVHAVYF